VANLHDNVFLYPLRRPKVITYRLYVSRAKPYVTVVTSAPGIEEYKKIHSPTRRSDSLRAQAKC